MNNELVIKLALVYDTRQEAEEASKRFEVCNVFYTPFYAKHWQVTVFERMNDYEP